jgi:H+/Cl- antiporter ClcA
VSRHEQPRPGALFGASRKPHAKLSSSHLPDFHTVLPVVFTLSSLRRLPEDTRGLVSTVIFAASAGGSAVAFLWLTNLVFHLGIERLAAASPFVFVSASLGIITVTSVASGLLMHSLAPDSAGSGVPQLKAAYWKDLGFVRFRATAVKFVAGALTLGGGTSLGREGPSQSQAKCEQLFLNENSPVRNQSETCR